MGTIVSILSRSTPVDSLIAERMLAAAPHRGSVHLVRQCGSCVLGISNTDNFVDATISRDGEKMAALCGKLDNATELAKSLTASGFPPASLQDADIVVSAFKAFGEDAPRHMRGAYSGIMTNGQSVFCFRDHIGLKPLFYRDEPGTFFAATEAKQIIEGAGLKREPDLDVVEKLFYGRLPAGLPCALKGVSRLTQAATLVAGAQAAAKVNPYWDPQKVLESAHFTHDELADRFYHLFEQAVIRTVTGKDAILLSGGVDSPTVAAFAAPRHLELSGRPLGAISAVYPNLPSVDESYYIKLVADYLGIDLRTYPGESRPLDNLVEWCKLLDGPCPTVAFSDMVQWYSRARDLGFRNILTGEYAEFLFTLHKHVVGHLLFHGRWKALKGLLSRERARGAGRKKIGYLLTSPLVPGKLANWYYKNRRVTEFRAVPEWIDLRMINSDAVMPDLLRPVGLRWLELQLLPFKGTAVTTEADELCATLSGVTVRRPFADIDLWEFFLSLQAEDKFPDLRSKTLVRSLMRGRLPDAILDRRDKTVFDDYMMSHIDYPSLERLIYGSRTDFRMTGVDYRHLKRLIEARKFTMIDWFWAKDLARVHAFLSLW